MPTEVSTDTTNQKSPNKITRFIIWFLGIIGSIIASIFLSIIIEWCGIIFGWWNEPDYHHAKTMFETELNWLLGDFLSNNSAIQSYFLNIHHHIYHYLIQKSGLEYLSQTLSGFLLTVVISAIYIIEVIFVRIMLIISAVPLMFAIIIVLIKDGLYIRKIRQETGGIERAGIYHYTKRYIKTMIISPIFLLLISPISIHPTIYVLTVSMVPGFFIWITAATYKKYV